MFLRQQWERTLGSTAQQSGSGGGECQSSLPVNNPKLWFNLGVIEREEIVLSLESQTPFWTDVSWPLPSSYSHHPIFFSIVEVEQEVVDGRKVFLSPVQKLFVGMKLAPIWHFTSQLSPCVFMPACVFQIEGYSLVTSGHYSGCLWAGHITHPFCTLQWGRVRAECVFRTRSLMWGVLWGHGSRVICWRVTFEKLTHTEAEVEKVTLKKPDVTQAVKTRL